MGSNVPPITPIFGRFFGLSADTSVSLMVGRVPTRRRAAGLLTVAIGDISEAPNDETQGDEDDRRDDRENPGQEEQGDFRLFRRQNNRAQH